MMFVYAVGDAGPEVSAIQRELTALGFYKGPIGDHFDITMSHAVGAFQTAKNLIADGKVGDRTWSALFGVAHAPCPGLTGADLLDRCIAITGVFETSQPPPACYAGLSGDFDGQGISFGVLQQNFGQRSLQPLLRRARDTVGLIDRCFIATEVIKLTEIMALDDATKDGYVAQMAWARSINDASGQNIIEPWATGLAKLGSTAEYRVIQHDAAKVDFDQALELCRQFDLESERAVAFMFDVVTQNGGISHDCASDIQREIAKLPVSQNGEIHEVAVLEIIAEVRAEYANPIWRKDVLARKTALAHGEGTVHGDYFNLSDQFGINLTTATVFAVA